MSKKWTGDLVGLMHDNKITQNQLAEKLGLTYQYVSMVLSGNREPNGAEERFRAALDTLISEQTHDSA